jgi:hypothetical protein
VPAGMPHAGDCRPTAPEPERLREGWREGERRSCSTNNLMEGLIRDGKRVFYLVVGTPLSVPRPQ